MRATNFAFLLAVVVTAGARELYKDLAVALAVQQDTVATIQKKQDRCSEYSTWLARLPSLVKEMHRLSEAQYDHVAPAKAAQQRLTDAVLRGRVDDAWKAMDAGGVVGYLSGEHRQSVLHVAATHQAFLKSEEGIRTLYRMASPPASPSGPVQRDRWGRTPLHSAASLGRSVGVLVLLSAGADPFVLSYEGTMPLGEVNGRLCTGCNETVLLLEDAAKARVEAAEQRKLPPSVENAITDLATTLQHDGRVLPEALAQSLLHYFKSYASATTAAKVGPTNLVGAAGVLLNDFRNHFVAWGIGEGDEAVETRAKEWQLGLGKKPT